MANNLEKKKLFVFCDGTWQDGVNNKTPLTNVATLARCLGSVDSERCLQVVYYDGGIGNVTSLPAQFIDAATGRGISAKIRNAYSFLSHNYNFRGGKDEIILVGFSRGAFTVQCLASFISEVGLLEKQYLYYLRGLFALFANGKTGWSQKVDEATTSSQSQGQEAVVGTVVGHGLQSEIEKMRRLGFLHSPRITACAVWDTVSTLGLSKHLSPLPLSFVGKRVPKRVNYAFQALALDEKRTKFQPCVWQSREDEPSTRVSQCWFRGDHGDVGGNGDAALGAVTLLWMIGKMHDKVGVRFDEAEILKHLKHKFLEWDVHVDKPLGIFKPSVKERRKLYMLQSSGQASEVPWYWRLSARKPRNGYLVSVDDSDLMEVHLTVRLYMISTDAKGPCILETWTTDEIDQKRVCWRSPDKLCTLWEQYVEPKSKEHKLLHRWSQGDLGEDETDRSRFVGLPDIQLPDIHLDQTRDGLKSFSNLLRPHIPVGSRNGGDNSQVMYAGRS